MVQKNTQSKSFDGRSLFGRLGIVGAALVLLSVSMTVPISAESETQDWSVVYDESGEPTALVFGNDQVGVGATDVVRHECHGSGPSDFWCTTGYHARASTLSHGFPLAQSPEFTGWLETVISSEVGESRFRCEWSDGAWTGVCQALAQEWPPSLGMEFRHECWSYTVDGPSPIPYPLLGLPHEQGDLPQASPSGVPGSFGDWTCYVST